MKTVLITGAAGFIGRNLFHELARDPDLLIRTFEITDNHDVLRDALKSTDLVYHLAGVNRPEDNEQFRIGNVALTRTITDLLEQHGRHPPIVFSSSTQATNDTPYGRSKNVAEEVLRSYNRRTEGPVRIYRLPNVFGKWSRPNYNTVVATFCHKIARGQRINISDPTRVMELVYIDDVVAEFRKALHTTSPPERTEYEVAPSFHVTLGELADTIRGLHQSRALRVPPDLGDQFTRRLYATFASFLPAEQLACPVDLKRDQRGWLFEFIKSDNAGQVFVSKTRPGVTRGNHFHDSKVEKFCVVQGTALIKLRAVDGEELFEYVVSGQRIRLVDIPPGYTHSIENIGDSEMIALFWASEVFDPDRPDTYACPV